MCLVRQRGDAVADLLEFSFQSFAVLPHVSASAFVHLGLFPLLLDQRFRRLLADPLQKLSHSSRCSRTSSLFFSLCGSPSTSRTNTAPLPLRIIVVLLIFLQAVRAVAQYAVSSANNTQCSMRQPEGSDASVLEPRTSVIKPSLSPVLTHDKRELNNRKRQERDRTSMCTSIAVARQTED